MSQHHPPGRRRAQRDLGETSDEAASHAVMATVWRAVSRAQEMLARHQSRFESTQTDDRLAEQLSLVAMLHDWRSVTEGEARDLTYLLDLYVEPVAGAPRDDVARALNTEIRRMAVKRALARSYES